MAAAGRNGPHGEPIREVGSEGGGQLCRPRDLLMHTSIYGEIFYLRPRFFTLGVYKIADFGKKEQLI